MLLSTHNPTLFRGMLAAAVALVGASACSRSDRADAGRDTTQIGAAVAPSDTQPSAATQPATTDTGIAPARETAPATQTETPSPEPEPSRAAAAPAETPSPEPEPSRAAAAPAQDTAVQTGQQDVSGYQAMGNDTSASASSDTARTEIGAAVDTASETAADTTAIAAMGDSMPADHAMGDTGAAVSTDTTTAGYEPMARDTGAVLAQNDTTSQEAVVTTGQAEADTTTIQVQVDTATQAPTGGDTLATATEPIRPPEDSTEVLGQVTTDEANHDVEAVGDADADVVGAAQVESTGNIATGAEAVALMTRVGQPCRVDSSSNARWDMAGSPATLNPCGTGTMTLPKVQTGEEK